VEDVNDMKDIKAGLDEIKDANPNFVDFAAHEVFRPVNAKNVADPIPVRNSGQGRERAHSADGESARNCASAFRAC
jgi:hypothetical protein